MGRGWVPSNYKSKSASKDRDNNAFKYRKKGGGKSGPKNQIRPFSKINKLA